MHPARSLAPALVALALWLAVMPAIRASAQDTLAMSQYNQKEVDWGGELRLVREHFGLDREQSAVARELLSGALSEQLMQRRVYDRRRRDWESQDESDQTKATAAAENQRYAARRLQIETSWLTEIRDVVLNDSQRAKWPQYERARRIADFLREQSDPGLLIPDLMRDAKFPPELLAAAQTPIESHLQALDDLARRFLALNGQWLAIRWGTAKGDADAVEHQRDELGGKLSEVLKAGLRAVCDVLPANESQTLRAMFEARQASSEMGMGRFATMFPYSDILKISTLTPDQHTRLDAALSRADADIIKLVRTYSEERRKVAGDQAARSKLRAQYRADQAKVRRRTSEEVRGLLSDAQRDAFDKGAEPPIDPDELRDRYGEQDDQQESAWENAG